MATTINSLSVNLGLDASGFIDGSKISRAEAKALAKDIEQARTPAEQLAMAEDRLEKAYLEGAITLEVYNRLLDEKRRAFLKASAAADAYSTSISKQSSALEVVSQAAGVVTGAVLGVQAVFNTVSSAIGVAKDAIDAYVEAGARIDEVADKAANLGLTFNELGALRFAAQELGGEGALGAIDQALGKMMKEGLVNPGETAVDAFKRIANEIRNTVDPAERVQKAADSFGKTGVEIVGMLTQNADQLERSVAYWEKTNSLTEAQVLAIGEFGDNMDRIELAFVGVTNLLVAELAPAFVMISEDILGLQDGMQSFKSALQDVVGISVAAAGYLRDWGDSTAGAFVNYINAYLPESMELPEIKQGNRETQWVQALIDKRKEYEEQAQDKANERAQKLDQTRIEAAARRETEALEKQIEQRQKLEREAADAKWEMAKQEIEREKREREKADREQKTIRDKNMSLLQSAHKQIEEENKRGPATAVFGTSEYTKAFAQSMNAGKTGRPTDEQILERAKEQLETQKAQDQKLAELLTKTGELVTVSKENGFRRI